MCIRTPGGEAKRARKRAQKDAEAHARQMQQQQEKFEQTLIEQKPKYTPPPRSAGAQIEETGVRRRRSKNRSQLARGRGMQQLRIPMQGSSTNIG